MNDSDENLPSLQDNEILPPGSIKVEFPKQIAIQSDDTEETAKEVDLAQANYALTYIVHNIGQQNSTAGLSRMINDMIKLSVHRRAVLGLSYGTKDSSKKDHFVYPVD